jgi:cell division septal protein FtsQ
MATKRKIISIHENKKQGIAWGRFFYRIALLSFIGAIIYSLFFAEFLSVNQIKIAGLSQLGEKNILNVINSEIVGKYLMLIEKNNLILINSNSIENSFKKKFIKIESVKITKKFPNTLIVNIRERESSMIFCSKNDCYLIDWQGIAYSKMDYSLPEVSEKRLAIIRDLSNKTVNVGETIFTADYIEYIVKIGEKVKSEIDIEMEKEYETPNRVSSDIRGTTQEGWRIFFNGNISLQKETDMLRIVLGEKIGDRRKDLEYVDLRSENKIYYKLKQGTQEEVNKEEESQKIQPVEKKVEDKKKKKK